MDAKSKVLYLFLVLEGIPFTPVIDLFASRNNKQFDQYVSYRPDPFASNIDAFTISWAETKFYCFPLFSCILRVVRKTIRDKARGVLVVPQWPAQSWYPMLLAILEQPPVALPPVQKSVTNAIQDRAEAPATQEAKNSYLSCIRGKLQVKGFSADAIDTILSFR